MALLQGTPINTSRVHPIAQLMGEGANIMQRAWAAAGNAASQSNQISAQFMRDALQENVNYRREQLEKERMKQQEQLAYAQMEQRERMQQADIASREKMAAMRIGGGGGGGGSRGPSATEIRRQQDEQKARELFNTMGPAIQELLGGQQQAAATAGGDTGERVRATYERTDQIPLGTQGAERSTLSALGIPDQGGLEIVGGGRFTGLEEIPREDLDSAEAKVGAVYADTASGDMNREGAADRISRLNRAIVGINIQRAAYADNPGSTLHFMEQAVHAAKAMEEFEMERSRGSDMNVIRDVQMITNQNRVPLVSLFTNGQVTTPEGLKDLRENDPTTYEAMSLMASTPQRLKVDLAQGARSLGDLSDIASVYGQAKANFEQSVSNAMLQAAASSDPGTRSAMMAAVDTSMRNSPAMRHLTEISNAIEEALDRAVSQTEPDRIAPSTRGRLRLTNNSTIDANNEKIDTLTSRARNIRKGLGESFGWEGSEDYSIESLREHVQKMADGKEKADASRTIASINKINGEISQARGEIAVAEKNLIRLEMDKRASMNPLALEPTNRTFEGEVGPDGVRREGGSVIPKDAPGDVLGKGFRDFMDSSFGN